MQRTQAEIAASVGCEIDGSPLKSKVQKLAEAEFAARERVRALGMNNTPTDYEAAKRAAVEYAEARAEAAAARRALDAAIDGR